MATSNQQSIDPFQGIEVVVDSDFHTTESLTEDVFPYLPDPFYDLLNVGQSDYDHIQSNFLPSAGYVHPFDYGAIEQREVKTPEQVRDAIDILNTDKTVITGGSILSLGICHHKEFAQGISEAYNDWMLDTLVDNLSDVYGAVVVSPQTPNLAAEEIDRRASEKGIASVLIPSSGVLPPLGDEKYFPIYEAAEDAGLPVMFHGGSNGVLSTLSPQWRTTNRYLDMHVNCHPVEHMFHLSTMLTNGVPEKFPDLKFVVMEAGIGWIPYFMRRYDHEYSSKRPDAPALTKPPSEYLRDQYYFTSQPIEGTNDMTYVQQIIRLFGGEENLMFSSDYPHFDFDNSNQLLDCIKQEFDTDEVESIYGKTALDVFDI